MIDLSFAPRIPHPASAPRGPIMPVSPRAPLLVAILGNGRLLLDSPLDVARQTHRLTDSESPPDGASLVGSFARNRDRRPMTLWRVDAMSGEPVDSRRMASVEDVVLGYLAAGRGADGLRLT